MTAVPLADLIGVVGVSGPDTAAILGGAAVASADQAKEFGGTHFGADLRSTSRVARPFA